MEPVEEKIAIFSSEKGIYIASVKEEMNEEMNEETVKVLVEHS